MNSTLSLSKMDVYSDRNQIRMLVMDMLDAGSTQKKVALDLGFNIFTIRRWWVKFKSGETLQQEGCRKAKMPFPEFQRSLLPNPLTNDIIQFVVYLKD